MFKLSVILSSGLLLVLTGRVFADNPAVKPVPRDDWSKHFSKRYTEKVKALKDVDVVFLGDSITHGWDWSVKDERHPGGKEHWEVMVKPYRAVNLGLSGDRIEQLLWRITEGGQPDGYKTRLVVLLIGTNNLHRKPKADSAKQVMEGVERVIEVIREKQPQAKLLVIALLPRNKKTSERRKKIISINETIKKMADSSDTISYLDVTHLFLNQDGSLNETTLRDGLHPSPKGYELFAKELGGKMREILLER